MKCKISSKAISNIKSELFMTILWAISDADHEQKLDPAFKDVFTNTLSRTLLTRVPYPDFPRRKPEHTDWISFLLTEAAYLYDDIWMSQLLKKKLKDKNNALLSTAGFYTYEVDLLIRICDRHNVVLSDYADAISDLLTEPWVHLARDLRKEYPERVEEINKMLAEMTLKSYGKEKALSHPAPSEMDYKLTAATVQSALNKKKKPSSTDEIRDLILKGILLSPNDGSEGPASEPEK